MIITQTPLRIGIVGGGTDLPDYYRKHGGRVLNCAIDKYIYVIVKERFDDAIYVNYSQKEIVDDVAELKHELVREAMRMAGVDRGVEITTLADIPSAGSGLGSSSSVTVGLLNALFTYRGILLTGRELAERACDIEIGICGKPIGKQDQYIAALGGIRDLVFGPGDDIDARRIELDPLHLRSFQRHMMLFYTGLTRKADNILSEQKANIDDKLNQLGTLVSLAGDAAGAISSGDIQGVGQALEKSWAAKRALASGVSNSQLDEMVDSAMAGGAIGAKVSGAGGGGFLFVICAPGLQAEVRSRMTEYRELPIRIDRLGSRVMMNAHRDIWG